MIGKIFITRSGYDPELGRHVKDPYLGDQPSMGACRPDIRRKARTGDHIFTVSGKVQGHEQYVLGGFEIERKISAVEAYRVFPERRLAQLPDGQLTGNIVVTAEGAQHALDDHNVNRPEQFAKRVAAEYLVGKNLIALVSPEQIARGRRETREALSDILKRRGKTVHEIVGRFGLSLTDEQVTALRSWLSLIIKTEAA